MARSLFDSYLYIYNLYKKDQLQNQRKHFYGNIINMFLNEHILSSRYKYRIDFDLYFTKKIKKTKQNNELE